MMPRVLSKETIAALVALALVVAAGCQQKGAGPSVADQADSEGTPMAEEAGGSAALSEVTLEVTGMS